MPSPPLRVVCVLAGDRYPDVYVARLMSMLERHLAEPFVLECVVDRPRALPCGVRAVDASAWGLTGWFNKLRLFDSATFGGEPFLYLDLTVVVKRDLGDLLAFARASAAPVVGVADWTCEGLNTCCLWVRPGPIAQTVWDSYRSGVRFDTPFDGDQDYANAVLGAQGGALAFYPPEMVVSYKCLRRLHRRRPGEAARRLAAATVLKFHGSPKPHELLEVRLSVLAALRDLRVRPAGLFAGLRYLADEVRGWWV